MLETILNYCNFTERGVEFAEREGFTTLDVYKFLHQAIADNHIPVTKPIGFRISELSGLQSKVVATDRYKSAAENFIEIASNLTDKVIIGSTTVKVSIPNCVGRVSLKSYDIMSSMKPVRTLYQDDYVLGALFPLYFEIYLNTSTGHATMFDNVKVMKDNSFFPLEVTHSIHRYCMICPPKERCMVEYRLFGGIRPDDIRRYLLLLLAMYSNKELKKEDSIWLSNYVV